MYRSTTSAAWLCTSAAGAVALLAEVLGMDALDELAELHDQLVLALGLFRLLFGLEDDALGIEQRVLGVDRCAEAGGERDGVRRPAGHDVRLACVRHPDLGVERGLA